MKSVYKEWELAYQIYGIRGSESHTQERNSFDITCCEPFVSAKHIIIYAIFDNQSFNDTLSNDIVVLNNWAQV